MTGPEADGGAVEAWPCQSICRWERTDEQWPGPDGRPMPVFSCHGCGSEWVRTEVWTPVDAQGVVPAEVLQERQAGAPAG